MHLCISLVNKVFNNKIEAVTPFVGNVVSLSSRLPVSCLRTIRSGSARALVSRSGCLLTNFYAMFSLLTLVYNILHSGFLIQGFIRDFQAHFPIPGCLQLPAMTEEKVVWLMSIYVIVAWDIIRQHKRLSVCVWLVVQATLQYVSHIPGTSGGKLSASEIPTASPRDEYRLVAYGVNNKCSRYHDRYGDGTYTCKSANSHQHG